MKFKKAFSAKLMEQRSGFTLLELLVVVGLIGIISAIVVVSLDSSRKSGDDAAVKSNLRTIANQAEIFYLDNGNSYGEDFASACPEADPSSGVMYAGDSVMAEAIAEAVKRGNGSYCYSDQSKWAVAVGLKSNANASWCIDSQGAALQINGRPNRVANTGQCAEPSGGKCGENCYLNKNGICICSLPYGPEI